MVSVSTWFWAGMIGMAFGSIFTIYRYLSTENKKLKKYYTVLFLIPFIATFAYLLMALNIGEIKTPNGTFFLPRYIDWLLTTPLLVLYLGMLAKPNKNIYYPLIIVDVLFIVCGVVSSLTTGQIKWIAYIIGVIAYLGLIYLLIYSIPKQASIKSESVITNFEKLRNLTAVLWTIYPVVYLLGPLGIELMLRSTEIIITTYLDLLTKVGFVIIALNAKNALLSLSDLKAKSEEKTVVN